MKRLSNFRTGVSILLALTLLCLAAWGWARTTVVVVGQGAAAASCSTSTDSEIFDSQPSGVPVETDYNASAYSAGRFTLAASTTITEIMQRMGEGNSNVGGITLSVYTNSCSTCDGSDDEPDTQIADTSVSVAASTMADFPAYGSVFFTLSTPKSGVASGTYWVVSVETGGSEIARSRGVNAGARRCQSTDGATWTCYADNGHNFEVYGCQP